MTSNKDNIIFEKTSFLQGGNSSFIKELYLQYLKKSKIYPWKLGGIFWWSWWGSGNYKKKKILGPSWAPKKNNIPKTIFSEKDLPKNEVTYVNKISFSQENYEKEKEQSVRAIALIRAYRIRGHLIANLDPLGMMERKYLHELHPADHGFKKEDYNKKIYLGSYMDKGG